MANFIPAINQARSHFLLLACTALLPIGGLAPVLAQVPEPAAIAQTQTPAAITGNWKITTATTGDGKPYTGSVEIQPFGDIYRVTRRTSAGTHAGIAFLQDQRLFVGWGTDEESGYGVVIYKIGTDGTLQGHWSASKSNGGMGTETATGGTPGQLAGDYQVSGTNIGTSDRYKGILNIRQTGDTYQLYWAAGISYRGVGVRSGDWLIVSWGQYGQLGVIDYVLTGKTAIGRSAVLSQPTLGAETLEQQSSAQSPAAQAAEQLSQRGLQQRDQGQFPQALATLEQAAQQYRQLGDRKSAAKLLSQIGAIYVKQGAFESARRVYQQALNLRQDDYPAAAASLSSIAHTYEQQGQPAQALTYYQQAVAQRQQAHDAYGASVTLQRLGKVQETLSQYPQALATYQTALGLSREVKDTYGEATILNSIGQVYENLGQPKTALDYYHHTLAVRTAVFDRPGQSQTLNSIGKVYETLKQYPQALEYYRQARINAEGLQDHTNTARALHNIGTVYAQLGNPDQALASLEQAFDIRQQITDRVGTGDTLTEIGAIYTQLGRYPEAETSLQQALAVRRALGDRAGEGKTLSRIGTLLTRQNQPELATVFYAQSVNVTESIRQNLRQLPRDQQESYLQTIADTYRTLADLFLAQGKILAAQQVLELLKVQELRGFTRSAQVGQAQSGIALNPSETKILQEHGSLIAFGQKLTECKQRRCAQLSQLNDQLDGLTRQYHQHIASFAKAIRDRQAVDRSTFDPSELGNIRKIVEAQPGTVLIYPFVLKDKLWLLWAAKGGVVKSVEVPVTQKQLGAAVLNFRLALERPLESPEKVQQAAKPLYDWLIKPLEPELKANQIQHLVFSLDRVTRYIPMAALFDGKQYLIENYTVVTVLSAALTQMNERLPTQRQQISVLALGASQFKDFNPLPNVPAELDEIVRQPAKTAQGIYPGLKLLNQAFDFRSLRDNLTGHKVLHIATHASFVSGRPEDSYLVLGTGEKLTIPEIQTLQDLGDVHLVVLSACTTAVGGADQDGVEISGLSSYFLNNGAAAVLASLWSVSDDSTRQLMQHFYSNLAQGSDQNPVTKAAALRQAQLSLLHSGTAAQEGTQRGLGVMGKGGDRGASPTAIRFAHPFFWAPFVLIGNGL